MDNEQVPSVAGSTTYYASLSREHNGRVKISASAHYTAPEGEDIDTSASKLFTATATAIGVATIAQAALERVIATANGDEDAILEFIARVGDTLNHIEENS